MKNLISITDIKKMNKGELVTEVEALIKNKSYKGFMSGEYITYATFYPEKYRINKQDARNYAPFEIPFKQEPHITFSYNASNTFLSKNDIKYIEQYLFEYCSNNELKSDFVL